MASQIELARVRREAARRESELLKESHAARRRLEEVLSGLSDQFFTLDRQWRFVFVNDRVCELTGLSREQLLGHRIWDLFPEAVGTGLEAAYRRAADANAFVQVEHFFPPYGRWFDNRVYPAPEGLSVFVADITDRKRFDEEREAHLRREQRRSGQLHSLADIAARLAAAQDVPSVIRIVADEARDLTEASRAVAVATPETGLAGPIRCVSPAVGDDPSPDHDGAPGPEDGPVYRDVAGEEAPRRLLTAPLFGRDGNSLGSIRVSRKRGGEFTREDESILAQLAQLASVAIEGARLYEELRRNDKRKDEFLAMLAHELRNPLAAIFSAVQLARRVGSAEHTEWAHRVIETQARNLTRMIDDLLDVSRITRGKIQLRKQRIELSPIIRSAVEAVRLFLEERRHRLVLDLASEPLTVDGDPTRLEQVLVNLLNNAAKYSEAGGRIGLTTRADGGHAVIRIEDTGIGMPPELLAQAFDLFTQGDRTSARTEGGLGIGLTLVKNLVEMHGGSVAAESEGAGKGSTLTVRLPLAADEADPPERDADRPPARDGKASRILVVDDNVDTAVGMAQLLRLLGHEVLVAHDGTSAIRVARSERPDVILLDIGLPGMDGHQVARTLRDEGFRRTVIIALTGYGEESAQARSRESGFDHHLVKPVDFQLLAATIGQGR